MDFKYGFTHKGQPYGWYKKELYRLPFTKQLRSYSLKQLSLIKIGNKQGYRVSKDKLSLQQLKCMTKEIDFKINIFTNSDTPF